MMKSKPNVRKDVKPEHASDKNGSFNVNKKQLKLILFLYGNDKIAYLNALHRLSIRLNWPEYTIVRIGAALERKGLAFKVSENPLIYELTPKCKNYIRMIRRGGV